MLPEKKQRQGFNRGIAGEMPGEATCHDTCPVHLPPTLPEDNLTGEMSPPRYFHSEKNRSSRCGIRFHIRRQSDRSVSVPGSPDHSRAEDDKNVPHRSHSLSGTGIFP